MMQQLLERWEELRVFMETGGDVLTAIFIVTLGMWTLIIERTWYNLRGFRKDAQQVISAWKNRSERSSWNAEQLRKKHLSELSQKVNRSLGLIQTLVALCPLLGLLGTVTGMIEVFDVMALVGSGNARAMASGVYLATVPTMAGMVAALSGMYFIARLDRQSKNNMRKLGDVLIIERGESCAVA